MSDSDLARAFERARAGWGGNGCGSSEEKTAAIVAELPALLDSLGVRKLVDLGCGTMSWLAPIVEHLDYTGLDVVPEVIEDNRRAFPELRFGTGEIPACDLVLCRDVIAHLPNQLVLETLGRIKRAAPHVLITSYPATRVNTNVEAGGWRPLNLQGRPFALPEPTIWIKDSDFKVLCLWETKDL